MYQKYSIGTMARLLGISAEAIRYYESRNIIQPVRDPETGYRYYNTWDFHMLLRARHYQNYGFSLEEVADLFRSRELSGIQAQMGLQEAGIQREKAGKAMLPDSSRHLGGAEYTVQIMEQAPVVIFVLNPLGKGMFSPLNDEDRIYELCNIQSVSAAIENMLLEATDMGIGSLWICDIFFAYEELCAWMDCGDELVAAVAFGYPEESPPPRPRKKLEDVVVWKR